MSYDSTADTLKHIRRVGQFLNLASMELLRRANCHDESKLSEPEKSKFDELTPKLKATTYNSDEYKKYLGEMSFALLNHYKNNSHHPEFYANGIDGMNLFDIVEMFFDWMAATERHADGNIYKSIEQNEKRFQMSEQLVKIFKNTVYYLDKGKEDQYQTTTS